MKKNAKMSKDTMKTLEVNRKIRGSWGQVNPVTKVIGDKRRKAPKHKGHQFDW